MYRRNIECKLLKAITFSPITLLIGARQTGKTTLMKQFSKKYSYITLDDVFLLSSARKDPVGFVEGLKKPAIIDEVQKAPEIFLPMKKDVDENRNPGRYILTGSANPLFIPKIGDSLAGRMAILQLMPLSQGELLGKEECFIDAIFDKNFSFGLYSQLPREELLNRIMRGGFPEMQQDDETIRELWWQGYLMTILQRDVQNLAQIEGITELPNLLKILSLRTGNLLNVADVARVCGLSHNTAKRYLHLLESLFLIFYQPSWRNDHAKRMVKAPKIHLLDTGFLNYLLNFNMKRCASDTDLIGGILESFVASELKKQAQWSKIKVEQFHFRIEQQTEVDIVLENGIGEIVGIEIKSGSTLYSDDFIGLKKLQQIAGSRFVRGIILYGGAETYCVDPTFAAIPLTALWSITT